MSETRILADYLQSFGSPAGASATGTESPSTPVVFVFDRTLLHSGTEVYWVECDLSAVVLFDSFQVPCPQMVASIPFAADHSDVSASRPGPSDVMWQCLQELGDTEHDQPVIQVLKMMEEEHERSKLKCAQLLGVGEARCRDLRGHKRVVEMLVRGAHTAVSNLLQQVCAHVFLRVCACANVACFVP